MKKILSIAFLTAVSAVAMAQPKAEFAKLTHDFGTIQHNGDGSTEFKLTNTGNEPLVISNAVGSCGCTVPEWPREPIMPGKQAAIKVKYDTNRIGAFQKTVTVQTNTEVGSTELTIKGNVVGKDGDGHHHHDHSGHGHSH